MSNINRRTPEERRERELKTCKHFNGVQNDRCKLGVCYSSLTNQERPVFGQIPERSHHLPCLPPFGRNSDLPQAQCEKREFQTVAEIEAEEAETKRFLDCLDRGVSGCCEAPINETQVIRNGPHKGHGPRFCSKCGKLAFMV